MFGGLAAAVLAGQHVAADARDERAFVVEGEGAAGAWVRQHMRQFWLWGLLLTADGCRSAAIGLKTLPVMPDCDRGKRSKAPRSAPHRPVRVPVPRHR